MRILLSKPDSLGDQLIAAGIVQRFRQLQPECRLVWHVRSGMEVFAPLIGAEVFAPRTAEPPEAEAARLAASDRPLLVVPYPLSPFEPWTNDVRTQIAWWAAFLRATNWDTAVLGLVNRNWVGDFTAAVALAPSKIGFEPSPVRQPLVNEAQALAPTDGPVLTTALPPSFNRSEAAQLRDLFAVLEPRLRELDPPPLWVPALPWTEKSTGETPLPRRPHVIIAPGVGADPRRAWGWRNFMRVADALRRHGAEIAWLEGPDDAGHLEGLPDDDANPRLRFGRGDLMQLTNALRGADLFLCHDTAYVHLAAGIGVPTVAIYGAGQHARFHPAGGRVKVVQSDIACAGCQWHCLWDRLVCVTDMPVEPVLAAAESMIREPKPDAVSIVPLSPPIAGDAAAQVEAVKRRLQGEILALNADRFARLQIIQSLIAPPPTRPEPAASPSAPPPPPAPRADSREPRLSVVVPMGRPDRVAPTLASLAGQQRRPTDWEIILVGIGADAVARTHPHLPIVPVRLDENVLPPRTRCLGVEHASGAWYLFLDDDVELAPDCHARFLELLGGEPFAPDATRPVGAIGFRLPGKTGRYFERLTDFSNFWAQQSDTPGDRDWLYSAAMLVRAEAYRSSGGFNAELPNGEDVDLTRRIAAAGYRLRYEPALVARHDHRRDTLASMWRYFWRNGNAARYFFADHGGACPFSVKTVWLKAWSDLKMNLAFQRRQGSPLGLRTPLVWLNYLIVESSLEWHWQEYIQAEGRYRQLPTRAASDVTFVRAMTAREEGRPVRATLRYALAVLQDFANPVRR